MIAPAPGTAMRTVTPKSSVSGSPSNRAPRAPSSAIVAARSSHMRVTSWRPGSAQVSPCGPVAGWTPISLGPVRKISHSDGSSVGPSLTQGQPSTSLRKARVAVGSVEYRSVCTPVIIRRAWPARAPTTSGQRVHQLGDAHPGSREERDLLADVQPGAHAAQLPHEIDDAVQLVGLEGQQPLVV